MDEEATIEDIVAAVEASNRDLAADGDWAGRLVTQTATLASAGLQGSSAGRKRKVPPQFLDPWQALGQANLATWLDGLQVPPLERNNVQ